MSHTGIGGPAGIDHGHHSHQGSGMIHHPDQSATWNMAVQAEPSRFRGMTINPAIVIGFSLFVSAALISLPYILDAIQGDGPPVNAKKNTPAAGQPQEQESQVPLPLNAVPEVSTDSSAGIPAGSQSAISAKPEADTTRFGRPRDNAASALLQVPPPTHDSYGSAGMYSREYSGFAETAAKHYAANPFVGPGYAGSGASAAAVPEVARTQRHIPYYVLSDSPDGKAPGKRRLMVTR